MEPQPTDPNHGEILVYQDPGGEVRVDVRMQRDTVWLSQQQMAELFGRERSVISRHLRNVFQDKELEPASVCAKFAHTAADRKVYEVEFYNLDAILSVGYRVHSKRGTQFRIWATSVLREHLLRGHTLNRRLLAERGLDDLQQAVGLLAKTLTRREMVTDEGCAVLEVVERYTRTWRLLLESDERRLAPAPSRPVAPGAVLSLAVARNIAAVLRDDVLSRGEAGALVGQERGEALSGSLAAVEQTFDGDPLYPSAQSRASHLLYFVIKDHPFTDGNKRLGALLFLEYLRRHGLLLHSSGRPRLADTAVVALALLIAESAPAQKDLMVRLVMSLLEDPAPG